MRLKEDSSSWKSGGIKRRDFRHDPGVPETEVPRHTGLKRKKKKHVHEYVGTQLGWTTIARYYPNWKTGVYERHEYTVPKMQYTCQRCGNKRGY